MSDFIMTDDPAADFREYDRMEAEELSKYPICDVCGYPSTTEYTYEVFGNIVCGDCIDNCRHSTDSYLEDAYDL